jgi:hypothetical protein
MTTFEIFRDDGTMILTTTVPPPHKANVNAAYCMLPDVKFKVLIKRDCRFQSYPIVHMFINNTYRIEHTLQSNDNVSYGDLFESSYLMLQPALNDINILCPITGDYFNIVKGKMYLRFVVVYPYKAIVYKHAFIGYHERDGDDVAAKHVYDVYLASKTDSEIVSNVL